MNVSIEPSRNNKNHFCVVVFPNGNLNNGSVVFSNENHSYCKIILNAFVQVGYHKIICNSVYSLCKHCDHFVEDGIHLYGDDEKEFDHDAEPGETHKLEEWEILRPELFRKYEDGKIGPNSIHYRKVHKK